MPARENPWLDEHQQRVWRQWLLAHDRLNAALNQQLSLSSGLSLQDFGVLVALSEAPNHRLRSAELATTLGWERSRLSHHLGRMEKRGLILREQSSSDGRGAYAVITNEGMRQIVEVAPGHANTVKELMFMPLSPEDLDTLDRLTSGVLARVAEASGGA